MILGFIMALVARVDLPAAREPEVSEGMVVVLAHPILGQGFANNILTLYPLLKDSLFMQFLLGDLHIVFFQRERNEFEGEGLEASKAGHLGKC